MENIKKQIEKFEKETGVKLEINDGKPYYGESLYLRDTGITSLPEGLTVGESLYLRDTGITSLPEGLAVGGYLDLEGCTGITSLPEGLTVGESLDLRDTGITSLPEGLTVGESLDLEGCTGITDTSKVKRTLPPQAVQKIEQARNPELRWEWAGRTYIKVDGIFSQLISRRGNVSVVRQIGERKDAYLVTDGNGRWAHGDTIAEARKDLVYKISNRDKSVYESLTLDSELTFGECIQCYRVITGACAAGTRNYVENRLPKPHKEKYTVREMIELTAGEYGSDTLKEFFKK